MKSFYFFMRMFVLIVILVLFTVQSTAIAIPPTIKTTEIILYAKAVPTGVEDCTSWANACDLKEALLIPVSDQIWVAAGIHLPTLTTDRDISFQLKSGLAIYGGFPADGGDWETRDWQNNATILSGNIGASGDNSDNSYHVVKSFDVDSSAIFDGFTITGGNANSSYSNDRGGGMYNYQSHPTISNVIFTLNSALSGGGLYADHSNPTLSDVIFSNNLSTYYGGAFFGNQSNPVIKNASFINNSASQNHGGGGIYGSSSSPSLENVMFSGNTAGWGGAIFGDKFSPAINNTLFENNTAKYGGAIYISDSSNPTITNTTFLNNRSEFNGGGMNNQSGSPILINVTFSGNSSSYGGAIYNNISLPTLRNATIYGNTASFLGGGVYNFNVSKPKIFNSIFWENTAPTGSQIYNDATSDSTVSYSVIQDGYTGDGNIELDPLLDNLADNGGFTQTHALKEGSPAIDAGNPDLTTSPVTDQRGFYRPIDGDENGIARCDIGAYEYGSSMSKFIFLPLIQK